MTDTTPTSSPTPAAAWTAPADAPVTPRRSGVTITLLPGQLLALAGGVLVLVSGWLDWLRPAGQRELGIPYGLSAYDVPARFLLRDSGLFRGTGGPSVGVFVVILAIVCLVAAFARPVNVLALPAGLGALALAVWFALRLRHFLDPGNEFVPGFGETLGPGVITLGLGGALAIAGGILSLTTRR
jgi:hypothetical protein